MRRIMYPGRPRRRDKFVRLVHLRRTGGGNEWDVSSALSPSDRSLAARLMPRVTYGGRKGWRAFRRLWAMGVRPHMDLFRLSVLLKGFELEPADVERFMAMQQMATVASPGDALP